MPALLHYKVIIEKFCKLKLSVYINLKKKQLGGSRNNAQRNCIKYTVINNLREIKYCIQETKKDIHKTKRAL